MINIFKKKCGVTTAQFAYHATPLIYKMCTVGQKEKIRNRKIPINSNTNYFRKMKLVPINVDYCVLQFDVLKLVIEIRLHVIL